ncbi:hypothetical protein [Dyadobacter tibetensis]|uniref:hypothetical protein n=1 Tax=Dyadobacter tibetensis TaxID=1211851 RepID=UPI0004722B3A|nr:hypothetical protein [Dyadobacter tibetensis]
MKKIILIASMCITLFACDKQEKEAIPETMIEKQAVVALRKTVVSTHNTALKVELLSVNDSRCPMNANCIIAGSAMLKFAISDGTASTEVSLEFSGVESAKNVVGFKLNGKSYKLLVTQVLPYPETSKTPTLEEYKVSVSISEQ